MGSRSETGTRGTHPTPPHPILHTGCCFCSDWHLLPHPWIQGTDLMHPDEEPWESGAPLSRGASLGEPGFPKRQDEGLCLRDLSVSIATPAWRLPTVLAKPICVERDERYQRERGCKTPSSNLEQPNHLSEITDPEMSGKPAVGYRGSPSHPLNPRLAEMGSGTVTPGCLGTLGKPGKI